MSTTNDHSAGIKPIVTAWLAATCITPVAAAIAGVAGLENLIGAGLFGSAVGPSLPWVGKKVREALRSNR